MGVPAAPAGRASLGLAADVAQRRCARVVSIQRASLWSGAVAGGYPTTTPIDRGRHHTLAADPIKRRLSVRVPEVGGAAEGGNRRPTLSGFPPLSFLPRRAPSARPAFRSRPRTSRRWHSHNPAPHDPETQFRDRTGGGGKLARGSPLKSMLGASADRGVIDENIISRQLARRGRGPLQ